MNKRRATPKLTERQKLCLQWQGWQDGDISGCICEINDRSSSKIDVVLLSQLQRPCDACIVEWTCWEVITIEICERATSVAVWGIIDGESCASQPLDSHEYLRITDTIAAHQAPSLWLHLYNSDSESLREMKVVISEWVTLLAVFQGIRTRMAITVESGVYCPLWRKCEDWNR